MSQRQKTCNRCHQKAELVCSRCNDSYCTIECQKADWPAHRNFCFKMPTLVPDLYALGEKLSTTLALIPKQSNTDGKPKLRKSPPKIPSRRISVENKVQSPPTRIAKIPEQLITKPAEVKPIKKQEVVAKKPEEIKKSQVAEDNPVQKKTEVEKDRKMTVTTPKLKIDPEIIVKQPAVPAVARGPMKFTGNEIKKPELEYKMKPVTEVKKKPEPEVVKVERVMRSDLKEVKWSDGKNLKVKIIAGLEFNIFTMCEASENVELYYSFISKKITDYCNGKPKIDYHPIQHEIVFALFEGEWYRAHVLDPHPKGSILQYIEYGNLATLLPSDMIPVPENMKFDISARDFVIDNMPEELNKKQEEILSSGVITITNVHKSHQANFYHCKIFGF